MRLLISAADIRNAIAKRYSGTIKYKGRTLFRRNAILNAYHELDNRNYRFIIQGSTKYQLDIGYSFDETISHIRCTCPFGDGCKHEVAGLLYLQQLAKNEAKKPSVKKVSKTDQKTYQYSGEFRKICKIGDKKFKGIIGSYCPGKISTNNYATIEHVLNKGNYYTSTLSYSDYYYQYQSDYDPDGYVELRITDGYLASRCTYCNVKSTRLCGHQFKILQDFVEDVEDVMDVDLFDYEARVVEFGGLINATPSVVERAFKITNNGNNFRAYSLIPGLLSSKDQQDAINSHLKNIILPDVVTKGSFLEQKSTMLDENWMNGLIWIHKQKNAIVKPYLIEAKSNKAKNKLISRFKEAEYPKYSNEVQKEFYRIIFEHLDIDKELPHTLINEKTLELLKENMSLLQTIFHFYSHFDFKDDFYDRKISKGELNGFTFSTSIAYLIIDIVEDDDFFYVNKFIKIEDDLILIGEVGEVYPLFVVLDQTAYLYNSMADSEMIQTLEDSPNILFIKSNIKPVQRLIRTLKSKFEVKYPNKIFAKEIHLRDGTRELYLAEVGKFVLFYPYLKYLDSPKWNILSSMHEESDSEDMLLPDSGEISEFKSWLGTQHNNFDKTHYALEYFYLHIDEVISGAWFLDFFDNCQQNNVEVYGQENLTNFKFNRNKAQVTTSIKSGIDWFDVDVDIKFGEQKASLKSWVEAVKSGNRYIKLDDGTIGVLSGKWFEDLKKLAQISEIGKKEIKLSKLQFNVIDELFADMSDDELLLEIQNKKKKLESFKSIKDYKIPKMITAELRPYQVQGYKWLKFLDEFNFGGCLADDMGLGKTLQVICLLADKIQRKKSSTHLVVMPRSLLFNWEAELNKFAPNTKFLIHHGIDRITDSKELKKYNIILTTYGTATNDIEFLHKIKFDYAVLDESQAIKNPLSKRYKAMRLLNAHNRLVMTGTPIENNTFDLFAQFSFINPGIFGSQKRFKGNFSNPIDVSGSIESKTLLKQIIYPFILRRTKEQVAPELPAKSESVIFCEMETEQRKMYDALKQEIRNGIVQKIDTDGVNKSKFMILDGLLKLRQICNSPVLLDKNLPVSKRSSAKIKMLVDHLQNNIGDHSALIFSQFVSMLSLIKAALEEQGIKYAYLDGSTRDRKKAVADFQDNDECRVFLISIKAGNTGLNLVKADYVYIMDPWWNPAVEAQAIDRTHRIGQDKHVFAYKMICQDSIEEKIVELQQKKKALASDLIQTDDNVFKSLNKGELLALFN